MWWLLEVGQGSLWAKISLGSALALRRSRWKGISLMTSAGIYIPVSVWVCQTDDVTLGKCLNRDYYFTETSGTVVIRSWSSIRLNGTCYLCPTHHPCPLSSKNSFMVDEIFWVPSYITSIDQIMVLFFNTILNAKKGFCSANVWTLMNSRSGFLNTNYLKAQCVKFSRLYW